MYRKIGDNSTNPFTKIIARGLEEKNTLLTNTFTLTVATPCLIYDACSDIFRGALGYFFGLDMKLSMDDFHQIQANILAPVQASTLHALYNRAPVQTLPRVEKPPQKLTMQGG